MIERRSNPRIEVCHTVLYLSDIYPSPKAALTIDLGLGGSRIETLCNLLSGESLRFFLAIHSQVIKCRGKVVHTVQGRGEKLKVGVRFEEMSDRDKLYLKQYLLDLMEQKMADHFSEETSH